MRVRNLLISGALLAGTLGWLSSYADEPKVTKPVYNIFSDEEEVTIGRNAAAQIEKKWPILHDRLLQAYLDYVGQKVARESRRPQLEYHFKLVDTPTINAFALPGGFIYVNRGLLAFVESESELIAVLGHEVGHIVAYHGTNELSRRVLLERIIKEGKKVGVLNDKEVKDILKRLGGSIALFVERKFSRDEEREADLLGLYNEVRSGWNPAGMINFFGRMKKFTGNPTLLQVLLSTHPLPAERVERARAEIAQLPPAPDLADDSLMFKAAKARMKFLPPPPKPAPKK
ncbi:MAG: M48 family metalloprotease [Terriglobia bacterium]